MRSLNGPVVVAVGPGSGHDVAAVVGWNNYPHRLFPVAIQQHPPNHTVLVENF